MGLWALQSGVVEVYRRGRGVDLLYRRRRGCLVHVEARVVALYIGLRPHQG